MHQTTKAEHNIAVQVLGVFVFLFGLVICFTGIGFIIGIPLMIASAYMGYKKRKIWKCRQCGYFFDRD